MSVYTLLKYVGYYNMRSVYVTDGFPHKKLGRGVGGWRELNPSVLGIFGILLTLQSHLTYSSTCSRPGI